jgi:hypothetical protein
MSPYVSAQLYRIPSVNKVEKEIYYLTQIERDDIGRTLARQMIKQLAAQYGELFSEFESLEFGGLYGGCTPENRKAVQERAAADPEFKTMIEAFRDGINGAWGEANRIQNEKADRLREDLDIKAAAQTKLAKNIACISPFADFLYLATDLTGTGLRSLEHFERVAGEYYEIFDSYLGEKAEEAVENDPTWDSNTFLDIGDRPRFVFKEELLKDKLGGVLPYWGVLVLFNVVFFGLAFVGFLRYDVR